ncbi:Histone-lysine N-methyltransferase SETMAR like protein [Argiope bruennichi]|uniref:Histone-lysine N-methyltransferase SETMAR like protein n=1 Tax=Argiope bruennichi TaxID=94029 RepID=A0A8T0DZS1_ARGBR|nr:Histone-lysine N-methyltransferase SETMAR like protein [Argiope bruennichi]
MEGSRNITGDETWAQHFTQETKQASMGWIHTPSPVGIKSKVPTSMGKVKATVFSIAKELSIPSLCGRARPLMLSYYETLRYLRKAVKNKRRGKLSKDIVLLHDNARPHKASSTQSLLLSFGWKIWQYLSFIPDLVSCHFHVFGKLKENLDENHFPNNEQVQAAVLSWLQDQAAIFYNQGIELLVLM